MKSASPFIKFLGTGGGRYVMTRQLRYTAGFWIGFGDTRIHVDPGPGALVRCHASRPRLDPERLDAVLVTHRHIDHCNDASVMIEAMTRFGTRPRGTVFLPADALAPDPVLFPHTLAYLASPPRVMHSGDRHRVGEIVVEIGPRHRHPVETYGVIFHAGGMRIAYITDTAYSEDLIPAYRGCDVAIVSTTLHESRPGLDHLCLGEVYELLMNLGPRLAVLTHFGGSMLRAKPWEAIRDWQAQLGFPVLAAGDGRRLELASILDTAPGQGSKPLREGV